ncbi:class I poly(R)-hydroxyalkanoic acid synthase [Pseudoduganella sp. FT55W]|uniref:Class I poly(R)-hydroxyalkanoic acid synthase n=1 Tax=Duganella rivi TaxID=2666083 RepID=A0A7X4GQ84_9BURK|nr:class I poly(R)-hydroxyalkanoic acid synthase [Duganella rivi]MYM67616.1 class I poly(R)-hydroxyalkanoic acid synthase [Duganella rivi]
MNLPDPQVIANAWMSQMSDPGQWQSWFSGAPTTEAHPLAAMMQDVGVHIKQDVMEQLKNEYMKDFGELWQDFVAGKTPAISDRRFASAAWQGNPMSAFNAAAYLLNAKFLTAMVETVEATPQQKQKIRFAVQQIVDAMSPANFLATNPEAQQKLIETKGESLTKGLANMLGDMGKGHISLSDESAFEVGRNLAMTEGTVVYENPLFQLIQYKPKTDNVNQVPLLMVPPCINKFYILDLQPENSLVRYAVEQGNTVFLISWSNPDKSLAHTTWDDYVEKGVIEAIRVVQDITGEKKLNMFGFCVGGTIVATALAVLAARGEQVANSLTLLTTFLDFNDTGVLDVFVDEAQVAMREQQLKGGGLMPGRDLASTFSSLRPNDLVWNYVQSNYLKGNDPAAFDLLFWNSDSTNLPGPMFCWYLRNTYLENKLKTGKLVVAGEKVELGKIDAPAFVYGSREDHIVPWPSAYDSLNILKGKTRFVLGASGHIAGVINSPVKNKRNYWINDSGKARNAEAWFDGATEVAGSWWPEWAKFLSDNGGKQVKARAKPGNAKYKAIEAAPGRYVKVKAD